MAGPAEVDGVTVLVEPVDPVTVGEVVVANTVPVVGTVVPPAFGCELLLQPATASPSDGSDNIIASR
ncbi:MAG TPA: hypothetical protein VFV02_00225 [Acidimicrobiales bacterium]|nr:hypothetical protein [Acidimicrobiales bacterium]